MALREVNFTRYSACTKQLSSTADDKNSDCVDEVKLGLEQLTLENSSALSAPVPLQKDIQDKENVLLPPHPVKGFDFTPNTLNCTRQGEARWEQFYIVLSECFL